MEAKNPDILVLAETMIKEDVLRTKLRKLHFYYLVFSDTDLRRTTPQKLAIEVGEPKSK